MTDDLATGQPAAGDPEHVATQQDFGRELTAVRMRAGLTVRQVARAAGLPNSTAGDYFSGRHLPAHTQPEAMLKILRACGESDAARLAQWTEALRRAKRPSGRRSGDAPYRGLARFEPGDARWFFGREEIAAQLAAMAGAAGTATGLPVVLVGPSGSGKSSLLRAGVIALVSGPSLIIEPDTAPLPALRAQLAGWAAGSGSRHGVVIIDQFEAVFTPGQDEAEQRAFISEIGHLAARCLVVLALRADFYSQALRYPLLASALEARQILLRPMTPAQVRRAITEPARLARVAVQDGLVELLLRDLAAPGAGSPGVDGPGADGPGAGAAERAAYEDGSLPLLSHAMLATWEHSHGAQITIADYLASGGIGEALIRTAENVYGGLPDDEQHLARRLFLRLVHVADDAPPTRTAVPLSELRTSDGTSTDRVLGTFVAERLITVDAGTARITHDALLTAWPRLRSWIDSGMDDLRTRRRITQAARAWDDAGRERAALWRGSYLAIARDWTGDEQKLASLGQQAREFVSATVEAAGARAAAARRRTRRLQRLVVALTVLVVAVFGLAAYAFQQRQLAATARNDANSREVAVEAGQIRSQDPSVAAQLSVAAYGLARTPQAAASLIESTGSAAAARLLDSPGVVESVSISPGRTLLAVVAADGTLRLWAVGQGQFRPVALLLKAGSDPLYTTAFSPHDQVLAAAGAARTITLWSVRNPHRPVRLATVTGPANTVYSVAFSPDGRTLAAGSADGTVRLWDVSNPAHPRVIGRPLADGAGYVQAVAFAPGGTLLAAASSAKVIRLWNVSSLSHPVPAGRALTGPGNVVTSVAFSPDGHLLAAGSQDDKVWLWRLSSRGAVPDGTLTSATDWVNAVAFSPDGTELAAGSSDASALVWNVASRALVATLPAPQPVTSLTWDGQDRLTTGNADGTVSVWQVPPPILLAGSPAYDAVYSPSGRLLAVSSQDSLQLWSTVTRQRLAAAIVPGTFVNAVAFQPRAHVLAATYGDGMFQLWSTAAGLAPLGSPTRASATGQVESAAFSPDGSMLVTGGDDGTMRIWSVRDPARPSLLASVRDSGAQVLGVAFSPDGRTIAAASGDNLTRLWNVASPRRPVVLGRPLRGPSSYVLCVAFSRDGHLLAVGSADKTVRLWDVADPARPVLLSGPLTGPTGYIYGVAFSPDGTTLAAASTDGSVWLWHLARTAQPDLIAALTGPGGHVYSVDFAPGGQQVAAASADGTVRLWDTSPAVAARAICAGAGQPLTRKEWASYVPGIPYRVPCS